MFGKSQTQTVSPFEHNDITCKLPACDLKDVSPSMMVFVYAAGPFKVEGNAVVWLSLTLDVKLWNI